MSWDVMIVDIPKSFESVADIPKEYEPEPLGDRATLINRLLEVAPTVDFSDPSWGQLQTGEFNIEFNLGQEPVTSIGLHIRGGGPVAELIHALTQHLGLRAIDLSSGEFLDPATAQEGFDAWRAYRNQVIDGAADA